MNSLSVRSGVSVEEALTEAKRLEADLQSAGFDQVVLETAARHGFSNSTFEESEDEGSSVVEEFYPKVDVPLDDAEASPIPPGKASKLGLVSKLENQAAKLRNDAG